MLETVEGCTGTGFSKKESQQMASKLTLERLRKEPQFIDQVFAAKTDRTKMEEEPVQNVPAVETETDEFIIKNPEVEAHAEAAVEALNGGKKTKQGRRSPMYRNVSEDDETVKETAESLPFNAADTTADNADDENSDEDMLNLDDKEFDLSHISARQQSREEIIAAAEAAAFAELKAPPLTPPQ